MFGEKSKIEFSTSTLPVAVISSMQNEEDLNKILKNQENSKVDDKGDISSKEIIV